MKNVNGRYWTDQGDYTQKIVRTKVNVTIQGDCRASHTFLDIHIRVYLKYLVWWNVMKLKVENIFTTWNCVERVNVFLTQLKYASSLVCLMNRREKCLWGIKMKPVKSFRSFSSSSYRIVQISFAFVRTCRFLFILKDSIDDSLMWE